MKHSRSTNRWFPGILSLSEQGSAGGAGMRLITGAILLAFLPGVAVAFGHLAMTLWATDKILAPLAAGTVAGILLDQFLLRRWAGFETFEHELTHALAALLCLRRVENFIVTRHRGGWVRHSGGFGGELADDFIGLAPYVLPTFTAAAVLLRPFVPGSWFPWYDGGIGLSFGFHAWSTLREIRHNWSSEAFASAGTGEAVQTDIARRGFLYSLIYIVTVTLAIHGVLLAILLHGYSGVPAWGRAAWATTAALAGWAGRELGRLARRVAP